MLLGFFVAILLFSNYNSILVLGSTICYQPDLNTISLCPDICYATTNGYTTSRGCTTLGSSTCPSLGVVNSGNTYCCNRYLCNNQTAVNSCYSGTNLLGNRGTIQTCSSVLDVYCLVYSQFYVINKGCASNCTPSFYISCCTSQNCNSLNVVHSCYIGTDGSYITMFCNSENVACNTYISGGSVTKTCTSRCVANSTSACCYSPYCNVALSPVGYCYTGANKGVVSSCTITDTTCVTYLNAQGYVTNKVCAASCTPSSTTLCCSSIRCNTAVGSCYVGTNSAGTITGCWSNTWCMTQITNGVLTKSCASSCQNDGNTSCCSTTNCNSFTPLTSCYVGSGAGTITFCNINTTSCMTTFKNGVVAKYCQSSCTANESTACCSTQNCNSFTPLVGCYLGNGTGRLGYCTNVASTYCKTSVLNGVVTKSCEASCTANQNTSCCSTSSCNSFTPVASCYSGVGQGTITSCNITTQYCMTSVISNVVYKSCANTCTNSTTVSCCNKTNCNSFTQTTSTTTTSSSTTTSLTTTTTTSSLTTSSLSSTASASNSGSTVISGTTGTTTTKSTGTTTTTKSTTTTTVIVSNCYVGTGQGTPTSCPAGSYYCQTRIQSGSVIKSCQSSCLTSSTTSCCTTSLCNSFTPITSCLTGYNSSASSQPCQPIHSYCQIQSINGTVMKSCQSTCTSNSYTLCCNTANCNTQMPISCYTGSIQSFSSSYCDFLSTSCQTKISNGVLMKSCSSSCVSSSQVLCCSTSNCNTFSPLSSCYSSDQTVQSCYVTTNWCKSQVIGNSLVKSCADTCVSNATTTCCSDINCNTVTSSSPDQAGQTYLIISIIYLISLTHWMLLN